MHHDSDAAEDEDDENSVEDGLPVHTLRAEQGGPIAVAESGQKVLRGGKGQIGVWNVDTLSTHGPKGSQTIGKKISTEGSWRDEDDYIEDSAGSSTTATVKVSAPSGTSIDVACWNSSPANSNVMISSMDKMYSCYGIDLKSAGKVAMSFLSHGGHITGFSTSIANDPSAFLTSSRDGIARLYDVREPLPALSIDVGLQGEFCPCAVYAHIQGIPTLNPVQPKGEITEKLMFSATGSIYATVTGL